MIYYQTPDDTHFIINGPNCCFNLKQRKRTRLIYRYFGDNQSLLRRVLQAPQVAFKSNVHQLYNFDHLDQNNFTLDFVNQILQQHGFFTFVKYQNQQILLKADQTFAPQTPVKILMNTDPLNESTMQHLKLVTATIIAQVPLNNDHQDNTLSADLRSWVTPTRYLIQQKPRKLNQILPVIRLNATYTKSTMIAVRK